MKLRVKSILTRFGPAAAFLIVVLIATHWPFGHSQPPKRAVGVQSEAPGVQLSSGQLAYARTFESYLQNFQLLADPDQARTFEADWALERFAQTGELETEQGLKRALEQLKKVGALLGCPEQFDGGCLSTRAVRAFLNFHWNLGDGNPNLANPVERERWSAVWKNHCDKTSLMTPEGTGRCIRQMRDSLGQRFDYVYGPEKTRRERQMLNASFGGIGVQVETANLYQSKLGGPLPIELTFDNPEVNGPAYGKLQFGDILVSIEGEKVDGKTIEETLAKFTGKRGSHLNLTVRRDVQGQPQLVDLELTLDCSPQPQCSADSKDVGYIGVGVAITHLDELKLVAGLLAHEPSEESPARGKISEGDLIVGVDGNRIDNGQWTLRQVVEKIHGDDGSKLVLSVQHKDGKLEDIAITRKVIEEHFVHFQALDNDIGYIVLDNFSGRNVPTEMSTGIARTVLPLASKALKAKADPTSLALAAQFDELKKALDKGGKLSEKMLPLALKARDTYDAIGEGGGVILNMSWNPGGDKAVLEAIADMTLPQGQILSMYGREPGTDQINVREEFLLPDFRLTTERAIGQGKNGKAQVGQRAPLLLPKKMPFVVMVGQPCASACELAAGMYQTNHRAVLIGLSSENPAGAKVLSSTRGKNSGQAYIELPYAYSLHVTNFEFRPAGVKSDWVGLIANKDAPTSEAQLAAAIAQINAENEEAKVRALAAEAALKNHHIIYDKMLKERADLDNKPVEEQDTSKLN